MAKSRAKKMREKIEREGRRNPELSRSPYAFTDLRSRRTKTKKDVLYRNKHKNQFSTDGRDGSFYFGGNSGETAGRFSCFAIFFYLY